MSAKTKKAFNEAIATHLAVLPSAQTSYVSDKQVRWATEHFDNTGIATKINEWREEFHLKQGRPPKISARVLLIAMLITALDNKPLTMVEATTTMYRRISDEMRNELGVKSLPNRDDHAARKQDFSAAYRNVRTALHALLGLVDPSTNPKNRVLTKAEYKMLAEEAAKTASAEELEAARDRLDWIANRLLEATMSLVPRDVRRKWRGSLAIDATPVAAYAQGTRKKSKYASSDPDAGWYAREGNHDPEIVDISPKGEKRTRSKFIWGYEATLAIIGADDPATDHHFPYLVLGMTMHRPGADPGGNATRVLRSINERGHNAGFLATDRAYAPNSKPENFQVPARELGYSLVFDYQQDRYGTQAQSHGAICVEGAWYCPMMPKQLIDATEHYRNGFTNEDGETEYLDEETHLARIAARKAYAVRRKDEVASGERWMCPAEGKNPLAQCEIKPASLNTAVGKRRVIAVLNNETPALCTSKTVTMPLDTGAKWLQSLPYGSDEWHSVYATLRNTIEGTNGVLKNGCHEDLDESRRRPIRGIAAATLFSSILIWSANIRRIRTFLESAKPTDKPDELAVRRKRKERPRLTADSRNRRKVRVPERFEPPPETASLS